VDEPAGDPADASQLADSLSLAFLVLLESLSPEQRAAFLLHDVFAYDYGEVAAIIDTSEQNARQLASRARRHVEQGRPRFDASPEDRDRLAASFFDAAQRGDFSALEALLAEDVELHGDGGGIVPAIRQPLYGRERVAQALAGWWRLGQKAGGVSVRQLLVNGHPGAELLDADGRLVGVLAFDVADGRIRTVRSIVNPEKLAHLGPVADLGALIRRATQAR
jgi:RNA polymerase sigma-70 factor (ECF subfamily)